MVGGAVFSTGEGVGGTDDEAESCLDTLTVVASDSVKTNLWL